MLTIPNIYQRVIVVFKDRQYAASIFEVKYNYLFFSMVLVKT